MKPAKALWVGATALIVVLGASAFFWLPQSPVPAPEKITVGASGGSDVGAMVFVAEAQGFFRHNGLDVTIKEYEAGKLAADALLAGDVDISTSAEFVFVSHSFDRDDLRILGTVAVSNNCELVARKDHGITQPSDLRGKKIGVTKKSTAEFFLGSYLTFNGLSLNDVEIVDRKPSELVQAMAKGDIDATLTWGPNVYQIKNELGEHAISWPGQSGQDYYFLLIAREQWLTPHAETVKRFVKALVQTERFIRDHPDQVQDFLARRSHDGRAYVQYAWQRLDFVVTLSQALLIAMEDEARWRIANKLTQQAELPNYLRFLYPAPLEAIAQEAVTLIR